MITFKISQKDLIEAIRKAIVVEDDKYVISLNVEDLSINDEKEKESLDDKEFTKYLEMYNINLKDIREIIQLSYSFWEALRLDHKATTQLIFKYHTVHKDEYKDKVYSEELILNTIRALSKTNNPILDFYDRIKRVSPVNYSVFEDYYKHLYNDPEE